MISKATKTEYTYPALFEPGEHGITVTFPDVPGAVTEGDTMEEALELAVDALELALSHYIETGQVIPKRSKKRGKQYREISVSALAEAKLLLYAAFQESGLTKAELARRAGIPKQHVPRLLNLQHGSGLDQLERAFAAVGKRISVHVDAA